MESQRYQKLMQSQARQDLSWIQGYTEGCHDIVVAYWQFVRTFGRKPVKLKRD